MLAVRFRDVDSVYASLAAQWLNHLVVELVNLWRNAKFVAVSDLLVQFEPFLNVRLVRDDRVVVAFTLKAVEQGESFDKEKQPREVACDVGPASAVFARTVRERFLLVEC